MLHDVAEAKSKLMQLDLVYIELTFCMVK